jgi:hypothetical protein
VKHKYLFGILPGQLVGQLSRAVGRIIVNYEHVQTGRKLPNLFD